ncbi:hypothetical protein ACE6H2_013237 [Prunus campanulata]
MRTIIASELQFATRSILLCILKMSFPFLYLSKASTMSSTLTFWFKGPTNLNISE